MAQVPIPPALSVPASAWSFAQTQLVTALGTEREVALGARITAGAIVGMVLVMGLVALLSAVGFVVVHGAEDARVLLAGLASGIVPLSVAGAALFGYVRATRERVRAQAALPLVRLQGEALAPSCPRCGAGAIVCDGVLGTCRHCGTLGLLPRHLVMVALRDRHVEIMRARARGEAHAQALTQMTSAVNAAIYDAFTVLGLAAMVAFPGYYALFPPRAYTGGPVQEDAWIGGLFAGLAVGGLFVGAAIYGRWQARTTKERP